MLGLDLPFVAELLEPLGVDVGDGDEFGVVAAPVAGCVGEGPAPQTADWPGADDSDSDFGIVTFVMLLGLPWAADVGREGVYGSSWVMGMM